MCVFVLEYLCVPVRTPSSGSTQLQLNPERSHQSRSRRTRTARRHQQYTQSRLQRDRLGRSENISIQLPVNTVKDSYLNTRRWTAGTGRWWCPCRFAACRWTSRWPRRYETSPLWRRTSPWCPATTTVPAFPESAPTTGCRHGPRRSPPPENPFRLKGWNLEEEEEEG